MELTDDPRLVATFRERLEAAGYGLAGLQRLLAAREFTTLGDDDTPVHARRLSDDPLSTLAALFAIGITVDAGRVERDLGPLEPLVAAGILFQDGDRIGTPLRILPFDDRLIAGERSDLAAPRDDLVPPPHRASMSSLNLTVRRPGARVLDLGAGGGCIAIALARDAGKVVATDVNPRALRFLRFNAILNEVAIDARQGAWLAPVDGERFDTVSFNPPFVVSPDTAFVFRDGDLPRDGVSRFAVEQAAQALAPGGFATVLINWVHHESGIWWEPLKPWVDGAGCDAWFLRSQTLDPLTYATMWNHEQRRRDPAAFEATLDRWLAYDEAAGIKAISAGAVILRRRDDDNWARAIDLTPEAIRPSTAHLLRLFEGVDLARTMSDPEILQTAWRLAPETEITGTLRATEHGLQAAPVRLTSTLPIDTRVEPRLLDPLLRCDGTRPLRDLVAPDAAGTFRQLLEEGWFATSAP